MNKAMETGNLRDALEMFFDRIAADSEMNGALKTYNCTIQFRIAEQVADQPPQWYGSESGEWYYVDLVNGKPTVGEGDVRSQRIWRHCPLVEIDREGIWAVLQNKARPMDIFFKARIHVTNTIQGGGATGRWVLTLLHMGQFAGRYGEMMPCGYQKSFMRLAKPLYDGPVS